MTVAQLESRVGINLLPSLSATAKATLLRLPYVKQRKDRSKND
jgi:endonuclease G